MVFLPQILYLFQNIPIFIQKLDSIILPFLWDYKAHRIRKCQSSYGRYDSEQYIDPDNNILNDIEKNCNYYTEEQLNTISSGNNISIIHFNSRSMYANFNSIQDQLSNYKKPFNIVAISETWVDPDRGIDFPLKSYELNYKNWENKMAGGVALYVNINLHYKILENMTIATDNVLECITIEIYREKNLKI